MSWLILLASFIGKLLAQLIPAIGAEIRRNNTVKQVGADHETSSKVHDHIATGVDMHGVRMDEADDSDSP
jgi:hypothetical protein